MGALANAHPVLKNVLLFIIKVCFGIVLDANFKRLTNNLENRIIEERLTNASEGIKQIKFSLITHSNAV